MSTSLGGLTIFHDGWNLIEERVANTNGTASTIHYYWGKDLSGTLQGAGGVGGLLYLTADGAVYVPFYDNNGNIMRYLDANGSTVAQYTYDAFGNTISQSGPLADFFRHRFSTKYFDAETGLYYYGHRFYSPVLRRWLTRDPIEEDGGLNLYGFCGNNATMCVDPLGNAVYVLIDPVPNRKENIVIKKDGRTMTPRGVTRVSGGFQFVCDRKCTMHVKGVIQLWIELLDENDSRWNIRYARYAGNDTPREDESTLAHEMDHFNTWKAFLDFVQTANAFDGQTFSDCADRATRYTTTYRRISEIVSSHSAKFDRPGLNQGGQYSRHPLDPSILKWE